MSPSPEKVRSQGSTVENIRAKVEVEDFLSRFVEHLALITGAEVSLAGFIIDGPDGEFVHPVVSIRDADYAAGAKNFSNLFLIQSGSDGVTKMVNWGGEAGEELYENFGQAQLYPSVTAKKGKWGISLAGDKQEKGLVSFGSDLPFAINFLCGREGSWIGLDQSLCRAAGVKSLDEIEFKK